MTSDFDQSLIDRFERFVHSSGTNSELLDDELLDAISTGNPIEAAMKLALDRGQSVVLTGTAGSGKTHLIRSLSRKGTLDGVYVCEDLASIPQHKWGSVGLFETQSVVAANEGALLAASRLYEGSMYGELVRRLHRMQLGLATHSESEVPAVAILDAAALDPVTSGALRDTLQLPMLQAYVAERLPPDQSLAWKLLSYPDIRDRLVQLVEYSSTFADTNGFTYRQIWQFIADLLEARGRQNWAYRVFFGRSAISAAIREAFPLESFSMPRISARLYYADFGQLSGIIPEEGLEYLFGVGVFEPEDLDLETRRSVRALALLSTNESPITAQLEAPRDLWESLYRASETVPLIRAINHYLSYGLLELGDDLELWTQLETERRTVKPDAQVSLGRATFDDFKLTRNLVADGLAGYSSPALRGTRLNLVHRPSEAVLSLSRDLVSGLSGLRSHRLRDRETVEHDWRLYRFLGQVAKVAGTSRLLKVALWDFESRSGQLLRLQLGETRVTRELQ